MKPSATFTVHFGIAAVYHQHFEEALFKIGPAGRTVVMQDLEHHLLQQARLWMQSSGLSFPTLSARRGLSQYTTDLTLGAFETTISSVDQWANVARFIHTQCGDLCHNIAERKAPHGILNPRLFADAIPHDTRLLMLRDEMDDKLSKRRTQPRTTSDYWPKNLMGLSKDTVMLVDPCNIEAWLDVVDVPICDVTFKQGIMPPKKLRRPAPSPDKISSQNLQTAQPYGYVFEAPSRDQ